MPPERMTSHEVRAINELHDDVEVIRPGLAVVDDADDIRVVELGHGQRLTLEAFLEVVIPPLLAAHDLDGDGTLKPYLHAFVDRAHAALTEEALHRVVALREHRGEFLREREFIPSCTWTRDVRFPDANGPPGVWHDIRARQRGLHHLRRRHRGQRPSVASAAWVVPHCGQDFGGADVSLMQEI